MYEYFRRCMYVIQNKSLKIHYSRNIPLQDEMFRNNHLPILIREVCPGFGHPALTSSFTKCKILQVKNSFAKIMNGLTVLKLFRISTGDLLFSQHAYSIYKVLKPRMTKLVHTTLYTFFFRVPGHLVPRMTIHLKNIAVKH